MKTNKITVCKHCGSVGSHYSFQCSMVRKPIKPKVGDTFKEKKVSYEDFTGVPYHKEFRITNISPSKPTSQPVATSRKKRTDSLPELLKLAEIVFNRWIRNRDAIGTNKVYFVCISCDDMKPIEEADCGHFRPKTVSSLRFNKLNNNAECQKCNREDPNHLIGYRKNLINKIGLAKVEELEAVPFGENYKWSREELQELIRKYK